MKIHKPDKTSLLILNINLALINFCGLKSNSLLSFVKFFGVFCLKRMINNFCGNVTEQTIRKRINKY